MSTKLFGFSLNEIVGDLGANPEKTLTNNAQIGPNNIKRKSIFLFS